MVDAERIGVDRHLDVTDGGVRRQGNGGTRMEKDPALASCWRADGAVEVGKVEPDASADGGWSCGRTAKHAALVPSAAAPRKRGRDPGRKRRLRGERGRDRGRKRRAEPLAAAGWRRWLPSPDGAVAVASAAAASGTRGLEGAGFGNWPSEENGSRNRCRRVARASASNCARIDWAARSKAHQGRPQAHRGAVRMRCSVGRGSPKNSRFRLIALGWCQYIPLELHIVKVSSARCLKKLGLILPGRGTGPVLCWLSAQGVHLKKKSEQRKVQARGPGHLVLSCKIIPFLKKIYNSKKLVKTFLKINFQGQLQNCSKINAPFLHLIVVLVVLETTLKNLFWTYISKIICVW